MNKSDLARLSIAAIHQKLKNKEIKFFDVIESVFQQIKNNEKKISAYISLFEQESFEQAQQLDQTVKDFSNLHPLTGIPFAIKDNICVKDKLATCGSRILHNFNSPYDATAVQRLKDAGVIIIGKTNLDEFAMGSSNETSYFGKVANPLNPEYVPGGSSGGSAAAIAYSGCLGALGTDTGGSVRLPAAFCGVVGLKPTYGRVSRYGLIAFASSLDCIGPITKTVQDAALILSTIAGHDPYDATSVNMPVNQFLCNPDALKDYTIGVPQEYFTKGLDPRIAQIVEKTIAELGKKCKAVKQISLPHTSYTIATYQLICTAEASSNLARYDGVKYGLRITKDDLIEMYEQTRGQGFGAEVKRRILLGTYGLSKGYYDEYYGTAQKVRALIKQDFDQAFKTCDIIITPTAPTPPFKLGEKIADPLTMYLSDLFTTSASLAGLPAISIPSRDKINGFPAGIQLIGRAFAEQEVLNCADAIEKLYA
ncbi:MAG: Asp-tRNA(Asn)/Glu-tRNA(Gln) amidotransferase subunit GatA [Candidatus Latescibacteria bacterium]|nr:Asp-tRNA(Asn)/Glu-tRNA(Gln) amidotransferase subunit GatA [Candidatus Latescibacterota bacterium]